MRRHGVRGLVAQRRRVQTTNNCHAFPAAPDLLNWQFTAAVPNQVWLANLTYVATGKGWLYMATVMDLHTRKIAAFLRNTHAGVGASCRTYPSDLARRSRLARTRRR